MSTLIFYAQFTASKVGVNSLTVTWDIERITRSDGTRSALVTGGANSVTVGRRGLYGYVLTGADLTLYDYVATAITATSTVDAQEVPALWTYWGQGNAVAGDAMALTSGERSTLYAGFWTYATRTLTSGGGSSAADVWDYLIANIAASGSIGEWILSKLDVAVSTRATPASPVASTAAIVDGSDVTILRGDTMSIAFTALGSLANMDKLYFTVKTSDSDIDTEAVIQIEAAGGLLYINGAAAGTPANGAITIDDSNAGDITVTLAADETALLAPRRMNYDVEIVRSAGVSVSTLTSGIFTVSSDVTRAIN